MTSAVECSPARIRITGTATSRFGQHRSAAADECAEVLEAVDLPAVLERRRFLGEMLLHLERGTRATPSTGGHRQRVQLFADRTISACVIASVNGRRIVNVTPRPGCDSMNNAPPSFLISLPRRPCRRRGRHAG